MNDGWTREYLPRIIVPAQVDEGALGIWDDCALSIDRDESQPNRSNEKWKMPNPQRKAYRVASCEEEGSTPRLLVLCCSL